MGNSAVGEVGVRGRWSHEVKGGQGEWCSIELLVFEARIAQSLGFRVPQAHGGEIWNSATVQLLKDSISRPGMGGSKRMSTSRCVWVPARTACYRHLITAVTKASQSVPPQKEHTLRSTCVKALATHTAQFINSLLAENQKEAAAHPRTSQQRCRT